MEVLLVWSTCGCVHRPQLSPVHVYTEGVKSTSARWLELLKDYDMNVHYHPGKTNVVVDALRRMSMGSTSHVEDEKKELVKDINTLAGLGVRLVDPTKEGEGLSSS